MAGKGKWKSVVAALERLSGVTPDYQQKVDAVKAELRKHPDFKLHASYLAQIYIDARKAKEAIEEELSDANLHLTAIEQMLVGQYEVEDASSIKLDSGESVAVQVEPYAQVEDREAYRQWCLKEGYESLMALPWGTTNSLTKDRLISGQALPPGIKIFAKSKIVYRK